MAATVTISRSLDERYMGLEPEWTNYRFLSEEELCSNIEKALHWYSRFYDLKQSFTFIQKYLRKHKIDSKPLNVLTSDDMLQVGRTIGFLCKIKMRGLDQLPDKYEKIFVDKMKLIRDLASVRKNIKKKKIDDTDNKLANTNVISVQERINTLAKGYVFDIEYFKLQDFIDNKFTGEFDVAAFCKINNIKLPTAKKMKSLLYSSMEEIQLSKTDKELSEYYRNYSVREKNKIIKFYDTILKDIDRYFKRNSKKKK